MHIHVNGVGWANNILLQMEKHVNGVGWANNILLPLRIHIMQR